MPSRVLREGILTSERVNLLKPQAEVFYRRIMSVVDDFGRFSALPALLRASCYPLRLDEVREADISRWLTEVESAGLIALYAVQGKRYLEMTDFRQQKKAIKSRYPEPPPACTEPPNPCTPVNGRSLLTESYIEGGVDSSAAPPGPVSRRAAPLDDRFSEFWDRYPKKAGKAEALKAWAKLPPEDRQKAIDAAALYAVACRGKESAYIKFPQGWLNGRRFDDDPGAWAASGNGPAVDPALEAKRTAAEARRQEQHRRDVEESERERAEAIEMRRKAGLPVEIPS